jgi:hypothetical protein
MMKTVRIAAPFNPSTLHRQLVASGIPVVTIRVSMANGADDVCLWGVVVFRDQYDPDQNKSAIQSVIDGHLKSPEVFGKKPSPSNANMEASLSAMEK